MFEVIQRGEREMSDRGKKYLKKIFAEKNPKLMETKNSQMEEIQ